MNDFARVIDSSNAAEIDRMSRTLKAATGDAVVVATVPSIEPYGDIREYANKLFENHGRGVGDKGKNNGLLILLAVRERKVWIEVGYDLEQWVTDGFAGETSRLDMVPQFRQGRYGGGLRIGTERIIGRIAQGRNVTLQGVRVPRERTPQGSPSLPAGYIFLAIIILLAISRIGGGPGRPADMGPERLERLVERRRDRSAAAWEALAAAAAVAEGSAAALAALAAAAAAAAAAAEAGEQPATLTMTAEDHDYWKTMTTK